jgi:hypothetical protein
MTGGYKIHPLCQKFSIWTILILHYATIRKVAGSSSDEVDFFNLPNLSSRIMTRGSTESVTEMSTRDHPGGKGRPAR